jgi:two-component system CheB/CheR fusion protein
MNEKDSQEFEHLLDYLKNSRGFDFRAYKRSTLQRRVDRRLSVVGIESYETYRQFLENEPDEFGQLFNTFLINVTAFFRDTAAWDYISTQVLPRLIESKRKFDPIRVWSAGCATGEEAYTLAVVLAEALGIDEFKSRVKIYATDIDDHALAQARVGEYDEKSIDGVPPAMLDKYFEKTNGNYCFRRDLRRAIVFGRHDLLQDAPISRVDLLTCRNTLMYFNAPAQARILARLHFALNEGAFLFLGRAETLLAHMSTFKPVELKQRVFSKIPSVRLSPQMYLMRTTPEVDGGGDAVTVMHDDIRDAALNITGVAQLVIDKNGDLILANETARSTFGVSSRDMGRPFRDLELSYRPVELRSLIDQAYMEQATIRVNAAEYQQGPNDTKWLDVEVVPITRRTGEVAGVTVVFTDVTKTRRLQSALERTNMELESAYEQLQSANEEMETTNEELQSAVEELETTNEELQASNEELETMNEELQSTNEELQTLNDVTRAYTGELDQANHLLESIFYGLGERVIVVDHDLSVVFWNKGAEELWGVRADEAKNVSLSDLDIGLPIGQIVSPIHEILDGKATRKSVDCDARNRRGKAIKCRVTIAPLMSSDGQTVIGAILLTADIAG